MWAERGGVVRQRKEDGAVEGRDGKGKGVGEVVRSAVEEKMTGQETNGGVDFKLSYLRYNELEYVRSSSFVLLSVTYTVILPFQLVT